MGATVAGCYARKSTEQKRDADASSVERQVQRAREFAARKGWEFSEQHVYVDDAISGAEWVDRPEYNRMKSDIDVTRPPFQILIVADLSRIGRDATRTPHEINVIEQNDIEIWSYLDDRRISVEDESGEIEVSFKSIASSFQRRQASKTASDELTKRAREGYVAGGRV